MSIRDAKSYVNQYARIIHTDRFGNCRIIHACVNDVKFLPFYGPCLFADYEQILLDRVVSIGFASEENRSLA